jgi:hypothetical protein
MTHIAHIAHIAHMELATRSADAISRRDQPTRPSNVIHFSGNYSQCGS